MTPDQTQPTQETLESVLQNVSELSHDQLRAWRDTMQHWMDTLDHELLKRAGKGGSY